ncbi:MAG: RNA polymerase sigma factor [Bacteroidetes bacterium]|jgi:RNA polymerase sigma factor (sigma-70 family)|nr:RNA polymerase sigma factor [Bacteroidota bacterium]
MATQDETILNAVKQYRKRLYDFIRVRVKESADAEDILQDVFYELTSSYRVLQPVEQMAAWLFRVARNKITDRYRKHKPLLYDDMHQGNSEDGEPNSFLEELLGAGDDPGFLSKDNELIREALLKALEELPSEQRDVFVQHELDQRSFKEISDETGVPVNTLLSRKHYAVKFLRKRLTSLYKELFDDIE